MEKERKDSSRRKRGSCGGVMICRTPGVYWIFSKKTKERTKRSGCGQSRNGEKGEQKRGKGD